MTIDLTALGWDADRASDARRHADYQPGRVAWVERGVCTVLTAAGPLRATLGGAVLATAARDRRHLPCVGDWVLLATWPDRHVTVEVVLPRSAALLGPPVGRVGGRSSRTGTHGQILVANLTATAVVEPMHPEPDLGRIARLLALVQESGARPLVVLTKSDLVADPAAVARQVAAVAPGVPVLPVSARRGAGLDPLRAEVAPGRTLGLFGPSRAGRSSLVNALAGAVTLPTSASRRVNGAGRPHSAGRALVAVPGGGAVVETPGVRAVPG